MNNTTTNSEGIVQQRAHKSGLQCSHDRKFFLNFLTMSIAGRHCPLSQLYLYDLVQPVPHPDLCDLLHLPGSEVEAARKARDGLRRGTFRGLRLLVLSKLWRS